MSRAAAPHFTGRIFGSLERWLMRPRLALKLALLAMLLASPGLFIGFQLDDLFFRSAMLMEDPEEVALLTGEPDVTRELMDSGILPWWTPESFRSLFFRPLSHLTTWVDYALWPDSPALMHAHSLLWFGLLVAAATSLYRRLLGPGAIAGLAALLYALDDAHAAPAAWLANRNTLIATAFGLLCILCHDHWRRTGRTWSAALGPACLAASVAAAEYGLATTAYLFAYAMFLDGAAAARRWLSLLPHAVVGAAWAIIYKVGGFGMYGSGMYHDPLASPLAYARALLARAPLLLLGQWTPVSADLGPLLPSGPRRFLVAASLAFVVALVWALAPRLRRDPLARFFAAGMLLSLLPVSATLPSDRLLVMTGFGGMGLAAMLIGDAFGRGAAAIAAAARSLPRRAVAAGLVLAHLVLAPLSMPLTALSAKPIGDIVKRAVHSLPQGDELTGKTLVVVNAPDHLMHVTYIPVMRWLEGKPDMERVVGLAIAPGAVTVSRVDARTLDVRIEGGIFSGFISRLFRSPDLPMPPGTLIELPELRVTIVDVDERGDPVAIRFELERPLEDDGYVWVRWREGEYVPFTPPPVGETVEIEAARRLLDLLTASWE